MRSREVAASRVTVSVASVSRRTGASAARETARPSAAAMRIPPAAMKKSRSLILAERVVGVVQRPRDLDREAGLVRGT